MACLSLTHTSACSLSVAFGSLRQFETTLGPFGRPSCPLSPSVCGQSSTDLWCFGHIFLQGWPLGLRSCLELCGPPPTHQQRHALSSRALRQAFVPCGVCQMSASISSVKAGPGRCLRWIRGAHPALWRCGKANPTLHSTKTTSILIDEKYIKALKMQQKTCLKVCKILLQDVHQSGTLSQCSSK